MCLLEPFPFLLPLSWRYIPSLSPLGSLWKAPAMSTGSCFALVKLETILLDIRSPGLSCTASSILEQRI
jgi:hypothetical protein